MKRSTRITILLTPDEKEFLREKASSLDTTMGELVRILINKMRGFDKPKEIAEAID